MMLANHPSMFLNDEAAASLLRLENDHGVQPITSAGRTLQEGKDLLARWNRGGTYNRPPYLYHPADPPETSSHYKNGGEAVDTTNWRWWVANAKAYGWVQDFEWDVVHFRYVAALDQFRNRPANNGGAIPLPIPSVPEIKGKLKMNWILLKLESGNEQFNGNVVLINMETRQMINLGNSEHSAVRAYYLDNFKPRPIKDDEWANKFGDNSSFHYAYEI